VLTEFAQGVRQAGDRGRPWTTGRWWSGYRRAPPEAVQAVERDNGGHHLDPAVRRDGRMMKKGKNRAGVRGSRGPLEVKTCPT